ncbi:PREDICTED: uncharacterized protein LOC105854031 [Condylura cristata]|uniref:uncharacterized protein LOC105854031 n=1 Tax=Condylura cristata TaxID=143302 RepID=UPI000643AA1D|nr:PREDICTED: uncharacterized protein LOC105854031 [Condylura cristata]
MLRPISARARRPGVEVATAQRNPIRRAVPSAAPWAAGGAWPAGREGAAPSGKAWWHSHCCWEAGTGRGNEGAGPWRPRGRRGTHGAAGEVPGQVQRQGTELSTLTAEAFGTPRPRRGDIRARRSRPPRQRQQIGGAAAPRVTAGSRPTPLPFSFLLPSAAPSDASAAPGPLRRGRLLPVACREKMERPQKERRLILRDGFTRHFEEHISKVPEIAQSARERRKSPGGVMNADRCICPSGEPDVTQVSPPSPCSRKSRAFVRPQPLIQGTQDDPLRLGGIRQ